FIGVIRRLRTTQDHRPVVGLRSGDDLQHRLARHQIGVEPDDTPTFCQAIEKLVALGECRVKNLDIETFATQERRYIQQPEGWVWPHDLNFLFVFEKEIAMSEQYVAHISFCRRHNLESLHWVDMSGV